MQYTEGSIGRVFILKFDEGDDIPGCIEDFANANGVEYGYVSFIGGLQKGQLVAGPVSPQQRPIEKITVEVKSVHETSAIGIIAPGSEGKSGLHMHGTLGREDKTLGGCLRNGMKTWLTGEAVVYEITGANCCRIMNEDAGVPLLAINKTAAAVKTAPAPKLSETGRFAAIDPNHAQVLHLFNVSIN